MRWLAAPILALLPIAAAPARAAEVTIYRCTDAAGRVALRDTPCRRGETQQVRTMQRPTDPPPRPAAVVPAPAATAAPREREVVVYRTPPRPMYECTTPDGERYLSDTGEGNPRWVPLGVLGYPVGAAPALPYGGGVHARVGGRIGGDTRYEVRVGDPPPLPSPLPPRAGYLHPAGAWVRDECHPLPQQDVCARLRDRRWELDRRYNSALQSERRRIDDEQRGIDARLAHDCRDL